MKEEGIIKVDTAKNLLPPEGTAATLVLRASNRELPAVAAAQADPDKQVLKLSKQVGPADLPIPAPASGAPVSSGGTLDDPKREVKGAALTDTVKPVDR
jgi:hypothetical protein